MSGLPPPPGGMTGLPPPPGMGGLPPPPGGLPPPPMSNGLGSGRGIPTTLGSGLPPPPGAGGLPPPPGGVTGLPPPPGQFNSGRGLGTTLPPSASSGAGLPPPPGMSGLPPPPCVASGTLPPPPGQFNSGRGLGTTLPSATNSASGLPPPPGSPGISMASGPLPSASMNSGRGMASMGTGLPPPPPGAGGLPPPPMSQTRIVTPPASPNGAMPPPPAQGMAMPPPPMANFQSGRIPVAAGMPQAAPPPGFQGPGVPPPQVTYQSSMTFQSAVMPPPMQTQMPPQVMTSQRVQPQTPNVDLGPESSLLKTCKECSKPCKDKYIFAFGSCYCPGCFKCGMPYCGKQINPPECIMWKEKPICFQCAKVNGKLHRCAFCQDFLINVEEIITLRDLNITIHADCLRCCECSCKLTQSNYQVIKDQVCCESCKHTAQQRACKECHEPILGRFIFDRQHYFHVKCFKCSECDKILNGKNFVVHHNRYYCPEQGIRYLKTCAYCKQEISIAEINKVRWQNKWYHKRCFVCRVCGVQLESKDCIICHNRPHCKRCFDQRVKEGDVTESGRTPSNHEHEHKPEASRQQRERFMKKFGEEGFRLPRYANDEEEKKEESSEESGSNHKSRHSSRRGSESSRKSSHSSRRGHESHRGHKDSSSDSSSSSNSSDSSSDHYRSSSHRSGRKH